MLWPYSYGCGEWCMRGLFELQTSGSYQMRLRRLTPVHLASSGAGWAAPWEQLPEMKTTNLQTSKLLHIEDLKGWNKKHKNTCKYLQSKRSCCRWPLHGQVLGSSLDETSCVWNVDSLKVSKNILHLPCFWYMLGFWCWAVFHTPWEKRQFGVSRMNSCKIKLLLGTTCLAAFLREIPLSGTHSKARSDTRRMILEECVCLLFSSETLL